jgi:vacuolar-type H+-ATPase subunit H
MVRNIDDVKTELRKLTSSKPVHAVTGAGVLASQTLKDLPSRLVQWTRDNPPKSLPGRANGYVRTARTNANEYVQTARTNANEYVQTARTNANEYVQSARTKAVGGYDKLAEHGEKALNGKPDSTQSTSATPSKSAAQARNELNGKPKGKAPSSRTGTSN